MPGDFFWLALRKQLAELLCKPSVRHDFSKMLRDFMSKIEIRHIFETPELIPQVADWIYNQFWMDQQEVTADFLAGLLRHAVDSNSIPLSLVAFVDGAPVGTINLIESDDRERVHLTPWLAALFVRPEFREEGVGSLLVKDLLLKAQGLGIKKLYLGTERSDFYIRLGAKLHELARPNFSILYFDL